MNDITFEEILEVMKMVWDRDISADDGTYEIWDKLTCAPKNPPQDSFGNLFPPLDFPVVRSHEGD